MGRRSQLRASDADRERIAEQLRDAAAEGRLRAEELEHRLEAALTARTYGELNAVISDLPRDRQVVAVGHRVRFRLRPLTVAGVLLLLPLALAAAAAAMVAVAALLTAWALAVTLAGMILGPRFRARRLRIIPWL
jgi:hypothetical protein